MRFHAEDLLGSLQPGKLADLVVLSADYLTVPETRFAPAVLATQRLSECAG